MRGRVMVLSAIIAVMFAGCSEKATPGAAAAPSLGIVDPSPGTVVKGNVVDLALEVHGIDIVKADGSTSGKTGHFHVFVDRPAVAADAVIPKEAGIVHATSNPLKLTGLPVGVHVFTVVLGNGAHKRIGTVQATTWVRVEGPSLKATAPATVTKGSSLVIKISVSGVTLAKADGKHSASTGHLHLFVDREPTLPGVAIPKESGIIHTTDTSVSIDGLAAGEHTVWVVLGDGLHVPFAPPVMDKVTVTVG